MCCAWSSLCVLSNGCVKIRSRGLHNDGNAVDVGGLGDAHARGNQRLVELCSVLALCHHVLDEGEGRARSVRFRGRQGCVRGRASPAVGVAVVGVGIGAFAIPRVTSAAAVAAAAAVPALPTARRSLAEIHLPHEHLLPPRLPMGLRGSLPLQLQ